MKADDVYCDQGCYAEKKREEFSGESNPKWNGGKLEFDCSWCGTKVKRKRYGEERDGKENKYCSLKCFHTHRGRKMRGENHPMWKGGGCKTADPVRRTAKYEQWRRSIFDRDDYTCQQCGAHNYKGRGSSVKLEVHHKEDLAKQVEQYIDDNGILDPYDDVFYQEENGVTLCRQCHVDTFSS